MADPRRIGHAQRRRIGGHPNAYADTLRPPSFSRGDSVKAAGRYGALEVVNIMPNTHRPGPASDGHTYVVRGGLGGRESAHPSSELRSFGQGLGELS